MTRFRCKCGESLKKAPLHQETKQRKGSFKINGRRMRVVGKQFVCKTHGTQKIIYN